LVVNGVAIELSERFNIGSVKCVHLSVNKITGSHEGLLLQLSRASRAWNKLHILLAVGCRFMLGDIRQLRSRRRSGAAPVRLHLAEVLRDDKQVLPPLALHAEPHCQLPFQRHEQGLARFLDRIQVRALQRNAVGFL
jgi:hypothetical protein